jgi:hypothetical protein
VHVPGIPVANVFFWKARLSPGRNVVEVDDGRGHSDHMVIYQKPEGIMTGSGDGLIQNLKSSNAANPAWYIDRPVAAQEGFYTDVDGESDNTFDQIPRELEGATWIATRRMSDANLKTDLSFRISPAAKGAKVYVEFSTGKYPMVTLLPDNAATSAAADAMRVALKEAGFAPTAEKTLWRGHDLNLAEAEFWSRDCAPGVSINIPGQTLDYVVMAGVR